MDSAGKLNHSSGIREFVVSTGGAFFTGIDAARLNSEVRQNTTFGVLKLSLHPAGYDWQFAAEVGKTFADAGSDVCHEAPPAPTPAGAVRRFSPQADAHVEESSTGTNYGTGSKVRADGGAGENAETYASFNVTGLSGAVIDAKLRLYAYTDTVDGPAVHSAGSGWTETGINWSNRPDTTSGALDNKGALRSGGWVEFDVDPVVQGNGSYSFKLAQISKDGIDFHSRESSNTSLRPELVVTIDDPALDIQPPATPSGVTATAPAGGRVDVSWNAAIDDVGVAEYDVFRDGYLLGTARGTSYADRSVRDATTYGYQVRARDAAGNRSAFSGMASVTTPTSATLTFAPQADARVSEGSPSTNYGTGAYLRTDGRTGVRSRR
jgi:hypothetical protein